MKIDLIGLRQVFLMHVSTLTRLPKATPWESFNVILKFSWRYGANEGHPVNRDNFFLI